MFSTRQPLPVILKMVQLVIIHRLLTVLHVKTDH